MVPANRTDGRPDLRRLLGREAGSGYWLLELLSLAGWRLDLRTGGRPAVTATRDGIELEADAETLPEAATLLFVRAMQSGRGSGSTRTRRRSRGPVLEPASSLDQ